MTALHADLEAAAWTMNHNHATDNLARELRSVVARATRMLAAAENGQTVSSSDARTLTAEVYEAARYTTEVNTLNDNRPPALRKNGA